MMKILVTGGNGFVGKFIVNHLSQNHIIFNPRSSELDLKNLNQVNQWFDQNHVDAVVHCALTGREELFSENPQYLSDGLLMFRNLWLNRHKFNRFINLGTAYEFDLSKNNFNVTGDQIINHLPTTSYGYAKNVVARIIHQTSEFYNLRLFGVFHETENNNRFFQKVKQQDEIVINNDIYLDYMYLPDILPMLELMVEGRSQNRDINMVYPTKYLLSEMAGILCNQLNLPTSKIKILNKLENNLTGDSTLLESYKFNLIGLETGLRNYK